VAMCEGEKTTLLVTALPLWVHTLLADAALN
jgi:hypothetical protein